MYKHILIAIDLNDESSWRKALPTAIEYCQAFAAQLHVMTVIPDFGMSIVGQFFPKGYEEDAVEGTRKLLHEFVDAHVPKDVPVQHIIGYGGIYQQILSVADQIKADLIVIAAHSQPDMKDFLLGPNAARVVRHATQSVLVVRE